MGKTFKFAVLTLFIARAAIATEINLDKAQGHVDFHAVGKPGIIKIHGKGEGPTGKLAVDFKSPATPVKGMIHFQVATLDTENNMRNDHMKNKYLEVAKYPDATLEIKKLTLPADFFAKKDSKATEVPFGGDLTLHGVTQPVSGTFTASNHGDFVDGDAHFETKISDYKIDVPSFSGITVADEVKVDVNFRGKVTP